MSGIYSCVADLNLDPELVKEYDRGTEELESEKDLDEMYPDFFPKKDDKEKIKV